MIESIFHTSKFTS